MSDFVKMGPGLLEGTMQALLEARKSARAVETVADSLMPLANEETVKKLEEVRESAAKMAYTLQSIYNRNAKEAFGTKE